MLGPVAARESGPGDSTAGMPHGRTDPESLDLRANRSIKVSVVVMTYNHENYIAQALDSVLDQQAVFPLEIIVTEDCSTDGTRDVVRRYADRHPNVIRVMMSASNLNDNSVLSRALTAARGQYIALLDGDDWWTAQDKLNKQVQHLDSDADASVCFHNVRVVYESEDDPPHDYHSDHPEYRLSAPRPALYTGLEELVRGNYIQTCSVMFRSSALPEIPTWYTDLPVGDWPLYVLLAQTGRVVYLDEVLAAYRVHARGVWSAGLSRYQSPEDVLSLLRTYDVLDHHLSGKYHASIVRASGYLHRAAAIALFRRGERRRAVVHGRMFGRAVGLPALLSDKEFWVNAGMSMTRRDDRGRRSLRRVRRRSAQPANPRRPDDPAGGSNLSDGAL